MSNVKVLKIGRKESISEGKKSFRELDCFKGNNEIKTLI